jgi:DNA-binding helix-hairpin-helix protein with protein kinase domain
MHEAPASFSWRAPNGSTKLTELQYLLREQKASWQAVVQPTPRQRLALAEALVGAMERLHRHGFVYGDISQANILWHVEPRPAVYLLDCDGIRAAGAGPVLAQADTPDWTDPQAPAGSATLDSDRYKLALAVGRILAQDAYAFPGQILGIQPGVLDEGRSRPVQRLFEQAAGAFGTRPTAGEWASALRGRGTIALQRATPEARPPVNTAVLDGPRARGTIPLT